MAAATNPTMNWSARNLSEEWRRFEQHAQLMFAGPLKKTGGDERAAYLLIWLGSEGREIFNSWNCTDEEGQNVKFLCEQFKKHFEPQKNALFSRYLFQSRSQKDDEPFSSFATDLRNLVKDCKYEKPDDMVRDRIVAGIKSAEVREKLLNEGDKLTMIQAMQIATGHETTQAQLKSMGSSSKPLELDAIKGRKKAFTKQTTTKDSDKDKQFHCKNCGSTHGRKQCKAFGRKCFYCDKMNHFDTMCLKKKRDEQKKTHKPVHAVNEESEDDDFFVDTVDSQLKQNTAYAKVCLNSEKTVSFKIDTGAQANILPMNIFKTLKNKPELSNSKHKLISYTGQYLNTTGEAKINCMHKDKQLDLNFHVVDMEAQPILGLQSCIDLKLVQLLLSVEQTEPEMTEKSVREEYSQLFSGMGDLGEARIETQPNAKPVVDAPRRVPHALKDRLKQELDKMVEQDVIERVTEPTDWVSSLVVVEKPNGKLRICLDPRNLNKEIKRPHYTMPTLEDAVSKMAGAKFFSKLDAQSGYWQIRLEEKSSYLTTFNSPFGRYRFKRLPFGIICAQDLFQRKMDELFEDMEGVTPLIDDVIIHGRTREEHDCNLRAALDKASENKLKLNSEKLTVGATQVEYFGHLITDEGLKPDPEKIKAIKMMPPPTNKKELQTVLGMITYLSKFAPQLSETTKPMRDLLKDDIEFSWDKPQEEALHKVKQIITAQPVLAFFDPRKPITLQVDASKHGLGATLMQERKPVAFASKSLNSTEQNYAQIEKELYAILFGCKRFHQYLYGQKVTVESDHKPLESISTKALAAAPPRLQRMLLQLQKYDLKIVHVPGKNIPVADTLSRQSLPIGTDGFDMTSDLEAQVHCVVTNLPLHDNKMTEIRDATAKDLLLQQLITMIHQGWPPNRQNCMKKLVEFWNYRDELTELNGIVFKGTKILIPEALREMMLDKLHTGHLGEEKTKQRARDILFWPGMNSDIQQKVAECQICARHRSSNPKEPMMSHEIPTRAWQKVATDLFFWNNRQFLVTVDYFSRWFEIDELSSTSASSVIRKLSTHFARFGIPEIVISDNGPQFSAEEFADFSRNWDFKHVTSSPGYPQSNGLAERTVQTVKRLLTKAQEDNRPPLLGILEYRNTPVDGLKSPAQLMMTRQLRSIMPVTQEQLLPRQTNPELVVARREHQQTLQKKYYDRTARPLTTLKTDDQVLLQSNNKWQPGRIVRVDEQPRSYIVQTKDGGTYRRNRRFIRIDKSTSDSQSHSPEESPETPPSQPPAETNTPTPVETTPAPSSATTTRSGRVVRQPRRFED